MNRTGEITSACDANCIAPSPPPHQPGRTIPTDPAATDHQLSDSLPLFRDWTKLEVEALLYGVDMHMVGKSDSELGKSWGVWASRTGRDPGDCAYTYKLNGGSRATAGKYYFTFSQIPRVLTQSRHSLRRTSAGRTSCVLAAFATSTRGHRFDLLGRRGRIDERGFVLG